MLASVLLKRGYDVGILCREFMAVIGNYKSEFERWDVSSDVKSRFNDIMTNPQTDTITDRPIDAWVPFNLLQQITVK